MRKIDKNKSSGFEKAAKTINFEKIVLEKAEEMAKKNDTTVSRFINMAVKAVVLNEESYHLALMKHHIMKYNEHKFLRDQAIEMTERNDECAVRIYNPLVD